MPSGKVHAITLEANGIVRVLQSQIMIAGINQTKGSIIQAIWDTGASGSCITQKVVDELKLVQTGFINVNTANGTVRRPTCIVDIFLKPDLRITGVTVTIGTVTDAIDCLIGMDVISLGDFSITNYQQKTCMSFRVPSMHKVDFVKDVNYSTKADARKALYKKPRKKRK